MADLNAKHEAAARKRYAKTGAAVARLSYMAQAAGPSGWELKGFSIRCPTEDKPDFLVTVRALDAEGAPQVAFHGAAELDDCLVGLLNRLDNGSLNWRPDQFGR